MGRLMICNGGVCSLLQRLLLSCIHLGKPQIVEWRCSCTQEFELLQEIQRCGRFTSNHADVEISLDKVRFAFTPNKPCCLWTALRTKAWNTLPKSGWQQNAAHSQCFPPFFCFFSLLLHLSQPKRLCFPPPQKLSRSQFAAAGPRESLSFRPKPARCRVVDQVAPAGMPLLSRSLWKRPQSRAAEPSRRAELQVFLRPRHFSPDAYTRVRNQLSHSSAPCTLSLG